MTVTYKAQLSSPLLSGEAEMTVSENGFTVSVLFDTVEIPFVIVHAVALSDYVVAVSTEEGGFSFARMGQWAQPFYDALCEYFNKAMLRAFFLPGGPLLKAQGAAAIFEGQMRREFARAQVFVFENAAVILPPGGGACRVPLCFVSAMDKGGFSLTLRCGADERYMFSKLGYDTDPFAEAVERRIRALRDQARAMAKEIDPALAPAQAARLASLIPEGAAAPIGQISAIAPSFLAPLERRIAETRADYSYRAFGELCPREDIWVGVRRMEDGVLVWFIAPSPDRRYAAVEFAAADTATFVYRTDGDFEGFARQLNRALEAVAFRREAIRLTDEELRKPGNEDYFMAAKRTASLRFVRSHFVGRAIHATPQSWKNGLAKLWQGGLTD